MKIGPVTIWKAMHSNGTPIESVVVLSLHWPESLTWRFSLGKAPYYPNPAIRGFNFTRTHRGQGFNFHLTFNSRLTGKWSLQTQPNMWNRQRMTRDNKA